MTHVANEDGSGDDHHDADRSCEGQGADDCELTPAMMPMEHRAGFLLMWWGASEQLALQGRPKANKSAALLLEVRSPCTLRWRLSVDHAATRFGSITYSHQFHEARPFAAGPVEEVAEPPTVMRTDVATAPLARVDRTGCAAEVGETVPIVAGAQDPSWVAPIVVSEAVRGEVHVAALGSAWVGQVVAREALPQIGIAGRPGEDATEDGLRAVPEVFEHLTDPALVVEPHDNEAARRSPGRLAAAGHCTKRRPGRP